MAHVPARYYRYFKIKKKGGGQREISTPRVFLKTVQRWILMNILEKEDIPPYVTGFVRNGGIVRNGRMHGGKQYLLRLDLANFFPSIGFKQVKNVFQSFGFSSDVSSFLSDLCLLAGVLPQGAPTSPMLANLVFRQADVQISLACENFGIAYSRYADDLTFSSDSPIPRGFVSRIRRIIRKSGFLVNEKKFSSKGPGQRLITTGMVVNVSVHPPRPLRRRLRAKFHQASLHPSQFVDDANELLGWAAFVNSYDTALGRTYLEIARGVQQKASRRVLPSKRKKTPDNLVQFPSHER